MKRTLILAFVFATTLLAKGQFIKSIGIKGGATAANQSWYYISVDNKLIKGNRTGFYAAASVEFLSSKYFSITTDLGYYTKGFRDSFANTTADQPEGDGTYTLTDSRFNYLSISPMFKARYEIKHFVPYVLLGVRLDNQLSYKSDINFDVIKSEIHKVLFGATLGAGLEYKLKHFGICLESQYHYDFTRFINIEPSSTSTGLAVKNSALIMGLGLKYYLPKK